MIYFFLLTDISFGYVIIKKKIMIMLVRMGQIMVKSCDVSESLHIFI